MLGEQINAQDKEQEHRKRIFLYSHSEHVNNTEMEGTVPWQLWNERQKGGTAYSRSELLRLRRHFKRCGVECAYSFVIVDKRICIYNHIYIYMKICAMLLAFWRKIFLRRISCAANSRYKQQRNVYIYYILYLSDYVVCTRGTWQKCKTIPFQAKYNTICKLTSFGCAI